MLARQSEIRYENGKADPREGAFPLLYLGFKCEENKRPENWQSSPPAGNKKSARRDSNPRPPPWQGGAPPLSHSRMKICYYFDVV